jgi:hypothetical protein
VALARANRGADTPGVSDSASRGPFVAGATSRRVTGRFVGGDRLDKNGQVTIVPLALEPAIVALTILKDRTGQSVSGAKFVAANAIVTTSGDNKARLWGK